MSAGPEVKYSPASRIIANVSDSRSATVIFRYSSRDSSLSMYSSPNENTDYFAQLYTKKELREIYGGSTHRTRRRHEV